MTSTLQQILVRTFDSFSATHIRKLRRDVWGLSCLFFGLETIVNLVKTFVSAAAGNEKFLPYAARTLGCLILAWMAWSVVDELETDVSRIAKFEDRLGFSWYPLETI